MRVIVRYQGRCLTLGYIRSSNNCIVGWYQPKFLSRYYIGEHIPEKDCHITYPRDGNVHHSYKYWDPADNCYYEKRVYHDSIILKRFDENQKFQSFQKLERDPEDFDQHMVTRVKPAPIGQVPLFFTFPLNGYSVDHRLYKDIIEPCKAHHQDDIILDLEPYDGRMLNVSFFIYDDSRTDFVFNMPGILLQKRITAFDGIIMEAYILVVPENTAPQKVE